MAKGFNLTAEINLRGPSNVRNIVADIRRQLGTIDTAVTVRIDPQAANNANKLATVLTRLNSVLTTTASQSRLTAANITQLAGALNSFQTSANAASRSLNGLPRNIAQTTQGIQRAAQQTATARTEIEEFGRQSALAVRRFAAFSLATGAIYSLVNAVSKATKEFIEFDRQLVRLTQITGDSYEQLGALSGTITTLATSLGVASQDLIGIADTLAQAGLSAKETEQALKALALTAVAPSFDKLSDTVEGAIALMRQFSISTGDLEKALSSINSVAAQFAVESSDIITAIQRTGGVFAAASKGVSGGTDALNEFIAVFTSVRATTRESAETIATGLRTIFTRIQRADTIEALKDYGVVLTDTEGKFVGAYKAVELLARGLGKLDPRDLKFSQIVEELGGFRQIGKVLPLIQQFSTAQDALKTAYAGQGSLAQDASKAQAALAIQFAKTREEFVALIRDLGNSDSFKSLVNVGLTLANTFIKVASVAKPLLPILTSIAAVRGSEALYQFGSGFFGGFARQTPNAVGQNAGQVLSGARNQQASAAAVNNTRALASNTTALQTLTTAVQQLNSTINNRPTGPGTQGINKGGIVRAFARGGMVPGIGNSDTVPAMLQPGEFVIRKKAVETIGADRLHKMNKYAGGGTVIRSTVGDISRFGTSTINKYKKSNINVENDDIVEGTKSTIDDIDLDMQLRDFDKYISSMTFDPKLDSLEKKQKSYDAKIGSVAEKIVMSKLGPSAKQYPGLGTRSSNTSNAPIDIIDDIASKIFEVKFKNTRTSEAELLSKLFRYKLETNSDSIAKQFIESDPTPGVIEKPYVDLGEINLVDLSQLRSNLDDKYRPFYKGGIIKKFMGGGAVTEADAANASRKQIMDILSSRPGGIETTGRKVGVSGSEIYQILGKRNPDAKTKALQEAIRHEYMVTANRKAGAAKGQVTRLSNQNLVVGAAGMFGNKFADTTEEIVSPLLSSSPKVRIISGIMDPKISSKLGDMFSQGVEDITSRASETAMISDILTKLGMGRELNLDFDRTLATGADQILSDPGTPLFSEFSNLTKVSEALKKAQLTNLGQELVNLVDQRKDLLPFMRVVTARPKSTLGLVQNWLSEKGLPIPLSQFEGFGGPGVSAQDIANLKAAFLNPGSLFVDDDARNIQAANLRKQDNISTYQYGTGQSMINSQAEGDIQGLLLEKVVQKLGGPGAAKGFGFDFPNGLEGAAKYFGLPDDIPTDVKRTISGPSTIKDNIVTYLKNVMGYKTGGLIRRFAEGGKAGKKYSWKENKGIMDSFNSQRSWYDVFEHSPKGGAERVFQGSFDDIFKFLQKNRSEDVQSKSVGGLIQFLNRGGETQDLLGKYKDILKSIMPQEYLTSEGLLKLPDGSGRQTKISSQSKLYKLLFNLFGNSSYTGLNTPLVKFNLNKNKDAFDPTEYSNLIALLDTQSKDTGSISLGRLSDLSHETFHDIQSYLYENQPSTAAKLESVTDKYLNQFREIYKDSSIGKRFNAYSSDRLTTNDPAIALGANNLNYDRARNQFPKSSNAITKSFDSASIGMSRAEIIPLLIQESQNNNIKATKLLETIFKEAGLNSNFATTMPQGYFWGGKVDPLAKKYNLSQAEFEEQKKIAKFMGLDDKNFEEKLRLVSLQKQRLKGSKFAAIDAVADSSVANQKVVAQQKALEEFLATNKFAEGGTAVSEKAKKEYGKISISEDGPQISAGYFKNNTRSGYASAYKMRDYLYYVGLSNATSGYGPRLYDVLMEAVTEKGAMLTADRSSVSGDARRVWEYYFKNRSDVKKTPLKPDDWTRNQALIDPKLYGREETWPPATDPAWVLQSGYSKSPDLINSSDIIRTSKTPDSRTLAASYFGSTMKGFAKGGSVEDTVPALLTPGEFVINKKAAQSIGYDKLHKLNHADKLKGYNKGGIVDGIQSFAVGGPVQERYNNFVSSRFNNALNTLSNNAASLGGRFGVVLGILSKFIGTTTITGKTLDSLATSAGQTAAAFYNAVNVIRGLGNFSDSDIGKKLLGSLSESLGSANISKFFLKQRDIPFSKLQTSLATFGTSVAAGAAVAFSLTKAFIDYSNALKQNKIEEAQKRQEEALTKSAEALDRYSKNQDKASLVLSNTYLALASVAAIDEVNAQKSGDRSFGIRTGASLGGGAIAGGTIGTLIAPGVGTAIGAAIGGTVAAAIAQYLNADRKSGISSEDSARRLSGTSSKLLESFNQRFMSGETSDSIMANPEWKAISEVIARSNSEVEAIIRGVEANSSLSSSAKKERIAEAIQIEASAKLRKQEQIWLQQKGLLDLDNATKAYAKSLKNMFSNMEEAINRSSNSLDNFNTSLELAEATVKGQASIGLANSRNIDILKNPRASSPEEIGSAARAAGSFFGSESTTISGLLDVGPRIESAVLAAIQAAQTLPGSTTDESIGAAIRKSVRNELSSSSLPEELSDKLGQQIAIEIEKRRKSGDDKVDFRDLEEAIPQLKESVDALKGAQDIAIKALEDYQQKAGLLVTKTGRSVELLIVAAEYLRKAGEIRFSAQSQLDKLFGGSTDLNRLQNFNNTNIRNQTGGPVSPNDILENINRLEKNRAFQQNQLDTAKDRGRSGTRDFIMLTDQLSKTTKSLRDNQQALEQLANNTEAASAALEKMSELQAKTQAGQNIIEKYVTSTREENFKLSSAFERLQNNMQGITNNPMNSLNVMQAMFEGGDNPMLAAEKAAAQDRRDTLEAFNSIAPFLGNGKEQNALRANVLESMLKESGIGITPMFNDVLKSLRNPEGDSEMSALIEQYKKAIEVQANANEALSELNKNLAIMTKQDTTEAFKTAIEQTLVKFEAAQVDHLVKIEEILSNQRPAVAKAAGGIVYKNSGGSIFQPQGTDTVPAMLTPGEFVVNRASAQKYGSVLQSINSNKYAQGGPVKYYQRGGFVSSMLKNDERKFNTEESASVRKDFGLADDYYQSEPGKQFTKNKYLDPAQLAGLFNIGTQVQLFKLNNQPNIVPMGLSNSEPEKYQITEIGGREKNKELFQKFIKDGVSSTAVALGFYPDYNQTLGNDIIPTSIRNQVQGELLGSLPEALFTNLDKIKKRYLQKSEADSLKSFITDVNFDDIVKNLQLDNIYDQSKYIDELSNKKALWDTQGKRVSAAIGTNLVQTADMNSLKSDFAKDALFLTSVRSGPIVNQAIRDNKEFEAGYAGNNAEIHTASIGFGTRGFAVKPKNVGYDGVSGSAYLSVISPANIYAPPKGLNASVGSIEVLKEEFEKLQKEDFTTDTIYSEKYKIYQKALKNIAEGTIEKAKFNKNILEEKEVSKLVSLDGNGINFGELSDLYVWSKLALQPNRNMILDSDKKNVGIDFPIIDSSNKTDNYVWSLKPNVRGSGKAGSDYLKNIDSLNTSKFKYLKQFAKTFDAPWTEKKKIDVEFPYQALDKLPILDTLSMDESAYSGYAFNSSTFQSPWSKNTINPFKLSDSFSDEILIASQQQNINDILSKSIEAWINSNNGEIPTKAPAFGLMDKLISIDPTEILPVAKSGKNDLENDIIDAKLDILGKNNKYAILARDGVLYKNEGQLDFSNLDIDPSVINNFKRESELNKAFDTQSLNDKFPSYASGFLTIKNELIKSKQSLLEDFINQSSIANLNLSDIAPWVKNLQDSRVADLFSNGSEVPNNLRQVWLKTLAWDRTPETAKLMDDTEAMRPGAFQELMSLLQLGFYVNGGKTASATQTLSREFNDLQKGFFGSQNLDPLSVFEDSRVAGKKGKQWWKNNGPDWQGFAKYNLSLIARKGLVRNVKEVLNTASQNSFNQEDAQALAQGIDNLSLGAGDIGQLGTETVATNLMDLIVKALDTTKLYTEGYRLDIADSIQKYNVPAGADDQSLKNIQRMLDPSGELMTYLTFKDAVIGRPVSDMTNIKVEGDNRDIKAPRLSNYVPNEDYINNANPWNLYKNFSNNFGNISKVFDDVLGMIGAVGKFTLQGPSSIYTGPSDTFDGKKYIDTDYESADPIKGAGAYVRAYRALAGTGYSTLFDKAKDNQQTFLDTIENNPNAIYRSKGGPVGYYAGGGSIINFQPKGTDTVPAMLTPGEFVINRQATQQHLPLLQAINSQNYQTGGIVKYLQQGSKNPVDNTNLLQRFVGFLKSTADENIVRFGDPSDTFTLNKIKSIIWEMSVGGWAGFGGDIPRGKTIRIKPQIASTNFSEPNGASVDFGTSRTTDRNFRDQSPQYSAPSRDKAIRAYKPRPDSSSPSRGRAISQYEPQPPKESPVYAERPISDADAAAASKEFEREYNLRKENILKKQLMAENGPLSSINLATPNMSFEWWNKKAKVEGKIVAYDAMQQLLAILKTAGTDILEPEKKTSGITAVPIDMLTSATQSMVYALMSNREISSDDPYPYQKLGINDAIDRLEQTYGKDFAKQYRSPSRISTISTNVGPMYDPNQGYIASKLSSYLVSAAIAKRQKFGLNNTEKTKNKEEVKVSSQPTKSNPAEIKDSNRLWYGGRLWDLNNDGIESEKIIGKIDRILDSSRVMISTNDVPGGKLILNKQYMTPEDLGVVDAWQKQKTIKPVSRQYGGIIYANDGQLINFQPKGTDTVPAMLTPGEFVINKQATQKHLPLLQSINNGYSTGGMVYLQQGGKVNTLSLKGGYPAPSTVTSGGNQTIFDDAGNQFRRDISVGTELIKNITGILTDDANVALMVGLGEKILPGIFSTLGAGVGIIAGGGVGSLALGTGLGFAGDQLGKALNSVLSDIFLDSGQKAKLDAIIKNNPDSYSTGQWIGWGAELLGGASALAKTWSSTLAKNLPSQIVKNETFAATSQLGLLIEDMLIKKSGRVIGTGVNALGEGLVGEAIEQGAKNEYEAISTIITKKPQGFARGGLVGELSGLYQSKLTAQKDLAQSMNQWFISPLLAPGAGQTPIGNKIDWKGILLEEQYSDYRQKIDNLFAEDNEESAKQLKPEVGNFIDALKQNVSKYNAGDYGSARNFLDRLKLGPNYKPKTSSFGDTSKIYDIRGNALASNELLTYDAKQLAAVYGKDYKLLEKEVSTQYPWFDKSKQRLVKAEGVYRNQKTSFSKQDPALKIVDQLAYEFKAMSNIFEIKNKSMFTDENISADPLFKGIKDDKDNYVPNMVKKAAEMLINRSNFLKVIFKNTEEGLDIVGNYLTKEGRDKTIRSAFGGMDPDNILSVQKVASGAEIDNIAKITQNEEIAKQVSGVKNNYSSSRILDFSKSPQNLKSIIDYFSKQKNKSSDTQPTQPQDVGNQTSLADDIKAKIKESLGLVIDTATRIFAPDANGDIILNKQEGDEFTPLLNNLGALIFKNIPSFVRRGTKENTSWVNYKKLIGFIETAGDAINVQEYRKNNSDKFIQEILSRQELLQTINPFLLASGGITPRRYAEGSFVNFQPQGTDTVPAMLTPGEFVINRAATSKHLPLLKAINSGAMSKGGVVYAQFGGLLDSMLLSGRRVTPPVNNQDDSMPENLVRPPVDVPGADRNWMNPLGFDSQQPIVSRQITDLFEHRDNVYSRNYQNREQAIKKSSQISALQDMISQGRELPQDFGGLPITGAAPKIDYESLRQDDLYTSIARQIGIPLSLLQDMISGLNRGPDPKELIGRDMLKPSSPSMFPRPMNRGGFVYLQSGDTLASYNARGTDIVPAMLTPGEFVVNRDAAAKNLPLLKQINSQNYQKGGMVQYYARGSQDPVSVSNSGRVGQLYSLSLDDKSISLIRDFTSKFAEFGTRLASISIPNITLDSSSLASLNEFTRRFDNFTRELSKINIPPVINITGKHDVNVNINGASVFNNMDRFISDLVISEVNSAFNQLARESDGAINMSYNPPVQSAYNSYNNSSQLR